MLFIVCEWRLFETEKSNDSLCGGILEECGVRQLIVSPQVELYLDIFCFGCMLVCGNVDLSETKHQQLEAWWLYHHPPLKQALHHPGVSLKPHSNQH